jgi:hypothetical protein
VLCAVVFFWGVYFAHPVNFLCFLGVYVAHPVSFLCCVLFFWGGGVSMLLFLLVFCVVFIFLNDFFSFLR